MDKTFKELIEILYHAKQLEQLISNIDKQLDYQYNQGYSQSIIDTLTKQLNKNK